VDSTLQTNDLKWLDSSCDSTRPSHSLTLTRFEKISDDSDSKGLWLDSWLKKYDSSTSLCEVVSSSGSVTRFTLRNDVVMTRVESHFSEWFESTRVTMNNFRLKSESFLQNLQTFYWQKQLVIAQRNELFLLQWRRNNISLKVMLWPCILAVLC